MLTWLIRKQRNQRFRRDAAFLLDALLQIFENERRSGKLMVTYCGAKREMVLWLSGTYLNEEAIAYTSALYFERRFGLAEKDAVRLSLMLRAAWRMHEGQMCYTFSHVFRGNPDWEMCLDWFQTYAARRLGPGWSAAASAHCIQVAYAQAASDENRAVSHS